MNDYIILTDSTSDMSFKMAQDMNVVVMNLKFTLENKEYINYLDGRDMSFQDFYDKMRKGSMVQTSQINVSEYIDTIRPYLESGKDVLGICFSSALSGTYNSFCIAKKYLEEDFPDRKIIVIDSKCASCGEGYLVYQTCLKKQEGLSIDDLAAWVEANKLRCIHWFTVDDIDTLKRGGRLTGAAAFFAKTLRIKPVLHVNNKGQLIAKKKVFGRKASIDAMFAKMKEDYMEDEVVFIGHGDCIDDANYLAKRITDELGIKEIHIEFIGPVIGAHSGPGTLAVFYLSKNESRE